MDRLVDVFQFIGFELLPWSFLLGHLKKKKKKGEKVAENLFFSGKYFDDMSFLEGGRTPKSELPMRNNHMICGVR